MSSWSGVPQHMEIRIPQYDCFCHAISNVALFYIQGPHGVLEIEKRMLKIKCYGSKTFYDIIESQAFCKSYVIRFDSELLTYECVHVTYMG